MAFNFGGGGGGFSFSNNNSTSLFGGASTAASFAANAGDTQQLDGGELLALGLEQMLDTDFVLTQTRLGEDAASGTSGATVQSLKATVASESRKEYLTAALTTDTSAEGQSKLERLSRELAALSTVGEAQYTDLADRRAVILRRLYAAYESEAQRLKMVKPAKRSTGAVSHPMSQFAILSGVHMMLALLETSGSVNPAMVRSVLGFVREQLVQFKAFVFANDSELPMSDVSAQALDAMRDFLFLTVNAKGVPEELRRDAIELLIGVAIARGTLSYFLGVAKYLLFPPSDLDCGELRVHRFIEKLNRVKSTIQLDPPSDALSISNWTITEMAGVTPHSMATDGAYVYVHCTQGLFKIGSGQRGTAPGIVYNRQVFRTEEQGSLAYCCGKLYYRSSKIKPAAFLVLSTEYLSEVGSIHLDGTGSIPTADNSALDLPHDGMYFFSGEEEEETADGDGDEAADDEEEDAISAQLRTLMATQGLTASQITTYLPQIVQMIGSDPSAMEEIINDPYMLYDFVEDMGGDMGFDLFDGGAPPPSGFGSGAAVAAGATADDDDDDEDDSKKKYKRRTLLTTDGEFLYALQQVNVSETSKAAEVVVHVFDPEDNFACVQSTPLRLSLETDAQRVLQLGKGTNGKFGPGGEVDAPQGGRKKRSKKKAASNSPGQLGGGISFGNPDALNFAGDITVECWFKLSQADQARIRNYSNIYLLGHGANDSYFYVMFSSNYVYVGCGNNFGSVSCQYNASMLDFTEWTHLATTNSDRTWKIYINGMMVTQTQGSMSGICKCTGDWSLGYSSMSPTEKLSGAVADFRIWNVCRSDAQISDNMSTLLDGDEEGLVGYWPLDEGLSLTAVDRSPSKCNGTIDVGTWDGEVEQRPFAAPVGTSFVNEMAFFFEPEVFDHGVVYTNGEAIGFYHHAPVKQLYGAVTNRAKFRAFQLADGALVDEALVSQPSHMESQAHLVGCYNGRQVAVYVLGGTNTKVSSYKLIPPSRVLRRKVAGDDEFPTVSDLLEAYPLPEFDEEELAAAPSIETLQDGTTLNAATTVLRLLASVSKEVSRHQYAAVDTEAPSNLRKSHIVELVPVTFDLLYDLLESLSGVYFAPETEEIADRDVLLFSLVTCVRLLKSNIRHLVTWNVSASECGFAGTGETSLRRRFVVLLERLSKEMPTASRAVLIAPDVQSEVCDALTEGLKIFYMEPEERVRVLSGLIEEVLASGADTSPLRIQLLERYFSGQSAPSNVIALVPAITAGYMPAKKNDKKKEKKKDDGGEGTSADAATAEDDDGITIEEAAEEEPAQMSYADFMSKTKLLNNVLTLVIQDTESKLLSVATDEAATAAAPEGGKDGEGEGDGAEEEGGANNSTNNTKSSGDFDDDDEDSSSSLLRFLINVQTAIFAQMSLDEDPHTSPHFGFLLNYANHLSEACAELLEFTVEHVINKHADSEDVLIQRKARVSTILRSTVGSLLLPLFSALWGQDYTPKDAARLVPSVSRLMRVIDTLTAGMPDTVVAEETGRDAANASTVTMVNTKVTVSTDHPVRQGITEKVLTIPGVKEFKLTFDAQTFAQGTGQGMVITLYKKPNQQEAIETVTNYTSELTIKGDTVYVNYNSGYMNSPWGFSVTGEGVVEERRTAMPWLVDLEKSIGVMIGKCAARLVRGSEVSLVEANTAQWLSSDLFREGATLTPEEREAERAMLDWLPWEKLESNEAAAAALRKSYETSPATASLLEDLIAGGTGPAALVVERLRKIATIPKFPVPASVKDEVNATVLAVAAVLMHHNMFGETLAEFAEEVAADAGAGGGDDDEVTAPEGLVKCFTHAHKLRRWFLDAFQKTRAAAKEDEEVSREVEYAKLSAQVRTVASFLITIVPATYNIRDAAPAVMARQTSIDDVEEISEEQLAARQTLMAWRSTTAGEVKFVTADEAKRFQMLWQMFLRFLSAEPDQEALLKALKERRLRACTRAVGLCTFSDVLSISKLASVRRELVGFVLPALAEKREEIYVGKNPTGMALLTGCGDALRSTVTVSLKTLYDLLVTQLEDPAEAGPDLIRATLHTFNLAFGDDQYPVALSAGIFPALKNLLSWVDEASDEAAALALAGASNETFHTSAWALLDALGTSIINSSTSLQPFINESDLEPLFEILRAELVGIKERLSVVAAVIDDSSAPAPGGSMEPLFGGADTTAGDAASLAGSALFPASTAGSRSNRGGSRNRRRNRNNRAAPRRSARVHQDPFSTGGGFGTASSWSGGGFGAAPTTTASSASVISTTKSAMAPTSFGLDAAGNDDVFDDALNVKVLSLLFSLCHWGEARKRFNSAEIIEALFTIVRQGTARERMVTGRLLRLLFTSEHAPDLSVLDACVVSIDESLGTAGSDATAAASGAAVTTFLIEEIGMAVAASANVLINSETGTHTHLKDVPIPSLHSADGTLTWTELAMFVRHLVYSGGDSWASAVMEPLQAAINDLPAIVGVLPDHRNEDASVLDNIEDQALDEDLEARLWRSLGALAVCGGMFDVMRTGGRVLYVANGFEATVVSRTVGSADVSVLREEDGTVSTVPQSELSVVHETPFDPSAFSAIDISPIIETFFSDALKGLVNEHVADSDSDEEDKKDGGSDDGGDGDDDDDDTARTNASKGKGKASTGDGTDSDDEGDEGEKAKKAAKKGKKKGKAGDGVSLISVSTLMKVEILARVSRVIYSYTLSPTFAADLLPSLHLDRLYALARGETELSRSGHDLTTMAAEDGIAFLYSELARRIRTDVTVRAVITDESLKISETFAGFEVHPTSELPYKRELAAKETLEAPLTYIRMDDACHAENCDGNIVVLDTYGPFQSRMEDAIAMGASAIVLVSSNPVKDGLIDEAMAEALALDDDVCPNASNAFHECTDACEELIAKRKAERKAKKGKKKGGRKGKGDDDGAAMASMGVPGEAIEEMMATGGEPEMAMMMAAMSAAGGGGGGGGGFSFGGAEPQALMSSAATGGSFGFGTAAAGGFGSGEPAAGSFGSGGGFGTAAAGGFGTAAAGDDGAATGGFSFGGGDDGAAAGGFGFGGGDDGAAAGGFGFGGGAATAETGGFSFGAAKVEEMKDPENMTLKELRAFIEEAEEDGADESEIAELEMMYKLKAKSAKANGGEEETKDDADAGGSSKAGGPGGKGVSFGAAVDFKGKGKGKGIAGAMDIGSDDEDDFSDDGSADGSKKKKQAAKKAAASRKGKAPASEVLVVFVMSSAGKSIRKYLNVPEEFGPDVLYLKQVTDDLVSMGYSEEHAVRALKKTDMDVAEAAKWLDENIDWLREQAEMLDEIKNDTTDIAEIKKKREEERLARAGKSGKSAAADDEEDGTSLRNLDKAWQQFTQSASSYFLTGGGAKTHNTNETVSTTMQLTLQSEGTRSALRMLMQFSAATVQHYAQRTLMNLFCNWPADQGMDGFGSQTEVDFVIQGALGMPDMFVAATEEMTLSQDVFKDRLVAKLGQEISTGSSFLSDVLHEACYAAIGAMSTEVEEADELAYESEHPYTQGTYHTETVRFPGATSLQITWDSRSQLVNGHYMYIYDSPSCNYCHVSFTDRNYYPVTIPGDQFYINFNAQSYYGNTSWGYRMIVNPIGLPEAEDKPKSKGTQSMLNALTLMTLLVKANAPIIAPKLLSELVTSLPGASSIKLAQRACHVASRLFHSWPDQFAVEGDGSAEHEDKLRDIVQELQDAYNTLRTRSLVRWEVVGVPLPHVQSLLELVLSARSTFPERPLGEGEEDPEKDIPEEVVQAYKVGRDGAKLVSLIDLGRKEWIEDSTEISTPANQSTISNYAADVCLRSGKWYWEFEMVAGTQFLGVGWVTREFQPTSSSSSGMNNSQNGSSWCAVGPSSVYWFSNRASEIVAPNQGRTSGPEASWTPGTVVGMYVDLDAKEMGMVVRAKDAKDEAGKDLGVIIRGFDAGEGLHPCISTYMGNNIKLNFGREPFQLTPPEGFLPIENLAINSASWLARYEHAANTCREIFERHPLDSPLTIMPELVSQALDTEMVPKPREIGFEYVETDGRPISAATGPDMVLEDDSTYYSTRTTKNVHLVFKIADLGSSSKKKKTTTTTDDDDKKGKDKAGGEGSSSAAGAADGEADANGSDSDDDKDEDAEVNDFVLLELSVKNPSNRQNANSGYNSYNSFSFGAKSSSSSQAAGTGAAAGLVFVTETQPDLEALKWCDDFTEDDFIRFMERKRRQGQSTSAAGALGAGNGPVWRPHEPVGYFEMSPGTDEVSIELDRPHRGQFVTVKILRGFTKHTLSVERLVFRCIHGSHPLSHLIEIGDWEEKAGEIREVLQAHSDFTGWTLKMDESVVALAQTFASKTGVAKALDVDAVMLRPTADDLIVFKQLAHVHPDEVRARFALLKYLNKVVTPLLQYVDVSMYAADLSRGASSSIVGTSDSSGPSGAVRRARKKDLDAPFLSHIIYQLKGLFFIDTKKSVLDAMLGLGAAPTNNNNNYGGFGSNSSNNIRITINRIQASKINEKEELDEADNLQTIFGQLFSQLRGVDYQKSFRGKKGQNLFYVDFAGEGSIDVGGPYREAITYACQDLMSDRTPLFIPSANQANSVGLNREKRILNPAAKSGTELSMFEFVGAMFGMALRTKVAMPVDLPSLVWKGLLGEEADLSDFEAVDKLCVQALDQMVDLPESQFATVVGEHFTTRLSDGSVVELKKGGSRIPVTYETRAEFRDLVIRARIHEADEQIEAMRKGLNAVVPMSMLTLFSPMDLELLVCGKSEIDVEALKSHTTYNGYTVSDAVVKMFWKCLRSFTNEEKQLFLRFVWGRNRLPLGESDWTQNFTINRMASKTKEADAMPLPVAHTCFFALDLPDYPTFDVMRSKLLYSIVNCQAIDTDYNQSSSLNTWL